MASPESRVYLFRTPGPTTQHEFSHPPSQLSLPPPQVGGSPLARTYAP